MNNTKSYESNRIREALISCMGVIIAALIGFVATLISTGYLVPPNETSNIISTAAPINVDATASCPQTQTEAANLFGGDPLFWVKKSDNLWKYGPAPSSPIENLFIPDGMKGDWWDDFSEKSSSSEGYVGYATEASIWCVPTVNSETIIPSVPPVVCVSDQDGIVVNHETKNPLYVRPSGYRSGWITSDASDVILPDGAMVTILNATY